MNHRIGPRKTVAFVLAALLSIAWAAAGFFKGAGATAQIPGGQPPMADSEAPL